MIGVGADIVESVADVRPIVDDIGQRVLDLLRELTAR